MIARKRVISTVLGILIFLLVLPVPQSSGVTLTPGQIYFDPSSIAPDYYTRVQVGALGGSHVWAADGNNVTDVDVLPVLKAGTYGPGYTFTQSDYYYTPNTDYSVDLTDGSATAQFDRGGMYHVRVTRDTGSQIYAMFVATGLPLEDEGADDKTGAGRVAFTPDGDLFLVADEPEPTPGKTPLADSKKILDDASKKTDKMKNKGDVVSKAEALSKELGRKIHLELVGHGRNGSVRLGPDGSGGYNRLNVDDAAKVQELKDFQKDIDDYVNKITFISCSTGGGQAGTDFLSILASSIGTACAWDKPIYPVYSGDDKYFQVDLAAKRICVPEPLTLLGLLMAVGGAAGYLRRRRAA